MDANDSNNMTMKLEEDNNERKEVKKYGKKKLEKRKLKYPIMIGLILIFVIILIIYLLTSESITSFDTHSINKEENYKSGNEKFENYCKTIRHLSENKKDDGSTPTLFELFLCSQLIDKEKELKVKDEKIESLEKKIKELENHIDLVKQKEKLKSNNYEGEQIFIGKLPEDSEGNIDINLEILEISYFISELKELNIKHFTYKNYVFWAYINDRALIEEGVFNRIIFSGFGFSWSRAEGFEIKDNI